MFQKEFVFLRNDGTYIQLMVNACLFFSSPSYVSSMFTCRGKMELPWFDDPHLT